MGEHSKIQWCDHTVNFWRGCRKVHVGCEHCYAESNMSVKLHGIRWGTEQQGGTRVACSSLKQLYRWNRGAWVHECGARVTRQGKQLTCPAHGECAADECHQDPNIRQYVFVNSLSDFFEPWDGPIHDNRGNVLADESMDSLRVRAFLAMDDCQNLDFIILTKHGLWDWPRVIHEWRWVSKKLYATRHNRHEETVASEPVMQDYYTKNRDNVIVLGSASDQSSYDRIVENLRYLDSYKFPYIAYTGMSLEPLLGPIDLGPNPPFWIIIGGESNQPSGRARKCKLEWIDDLVQQRDRMLATFLIDDDAVCPPAIFVKQLGDNVPGYSFSAKGGDAAEWPTAYPRWHAEVWDRELTEMAASKELAHARST